ncbi:phosphoglyceromutase [Candidatus Roizmanbacteria bacterium CG07_land_8_20_14_0_80_34_15]|uniref:2,3-bisphosphoglycerate-dependent phosphoglycerate mutase n=1 Tax=Candidatus Roizmanbacteria bacterium CG07_land_8_20_14_0_80_34_15 TaxID=1974849 RepID=A0A2M6YT01_9BACT|nr:MAG: phosphoglyceromutase [Candidatus Roizmanbacteria bacterium CG07_land_8_20_14_0_80_34_15]
MYKFVIIRHGLSVWPTRFTGWTDIDLDPSGIEETKKYGLKLKELGYRFDLGFTSVLKRGIETLEIVLRALGQENIPIIKDWHLNERNYGDLQGQNKAEAVTKYGEEQIKIWRRSYDVPPPNGESLKDTYERVVPYFQEKIAPQIKAGKKIIFSGHSNSIRALVKYLDNLTNEEIISVNIPYCIPLVYELDENLKPIKHYYLAPDEEVKRVIEGIKNQTKK